ncbi:MAG: AAA family ATPase [Rhodospirillales bacterium]|nr:MAG: AAA family ATPase [Rhodospirillales bacterium]
MRRDMAGLAASFAPPEPDPALPLEDMVVSRVRLAAALRAIFLHHLWRIEESSDRSRPADTLAEQRDHPRAEAEYLASAPEAAELRGRLAVIEARIEGAVHPGYRRLCDVFRLDAGALALLHLAWAYELDPSLGPLLRHVSPWERVDYPCDPIASRLFGESSLVLWRDTMPAARWSLIRRQPMPGALPDRMVLDPAIRAYLAGDPPLSEELIGLVQQVEPREPLAGWPVTATASDVARVLDDGSAGPVVLAVAGPPGAGKRSFAAAVAAQLGLGLVAMDLDLVAPEAGVPALIAAHRLAYLTSSALALGGRRAGTARLPLDLAPFPLTFVLRAPAETRAPDDGRAIWTPTLPTIVLPTPSEAERGMLWRRLCPSAAAWPEGSVALVAARHRSLPGAIAAVAASLPAGPEAAAAALRALDHDRFGPLAMRLDCPFTFEDLALPPRLETQLRALVHEARVRGRFWERPATQRLFPQGRGLVALFTGAPGTGKTMAAQVVAAALGLDLYRVEVSALVSKYIGETMENLQRILDVARQVDAVLLFDEADGFFARRTELNTSNDRHANQDTGYLLQAIESFPGTALLASNRKRNIDEAFARRLRHVIDFPAPDETARARIWRALVGELFGAEALATLAPALECMALRVDITGAQIKQAALTAAFAADADGKAAGLEHLLQGIEAELMKEGRALTARDRADVEALQ